MSSLLFSLAVGTATTMMGTAPALATAATSSPLGWDCYDSQAMVWCEEKYECACFGHIGEHSCKCVDDKAAPAQDVGHACGATASECSCPAGSQAMCHAVNEKLTHECFCVIDDRAPASLII